MAMAASALAIDIECAVSSVMERSASAPSSPNERTSTVLREIGNIGGHVKGRRVTFPDEDNIVTGYFEAPDPWSEESDITADNIVAAYRAACWKQGVKPLQKVLLQLQSVQVSEDLEFELNLKGENLNAHHCEALEEIFKRLQFRCLQLEDCHLDDEGAAAIFDMIEYYDSTSHLNISSNKTIGNQGWQACSKMLKKTPCLQYLDASKTSQNEQSLLILGRAFRTGCYLTALHFENCGIYGRPLVILVAALKLNITLAELYLGDNKICSADGLQLGNLLRSNSNLELLDLRNNNLQDLGICHLVDGLCQQAANNGGQCLKALIVTNNHLTYNGMAHINRALLVSESLTALDISQNSVCDEGIQHLKQGLLTNPSLQHLGLLNAKITCEGAVALAEFIADDQSIAYLDLRENEIKVAGLMALALSLKHNQSVTNLHVDQTIKYDMSTSEVGRTQQQFLDEIHEYCERNKTAIESEQLQERNVNFVVQNSVPTIQNETELASLLQPNKTPVHRTQSGASSYHPPIGMVCSASFPAGSNKGGANQSSNLPRNRFQVCRVFLDSEQKSISSFNSLSDEESFEAKNRSDTHSEESVFLPNSPNESGYNSNSSSPLTREGATACHKGIIRHQDSLSIHKQHARISSHESSEDDHIRWNLPSEEDLNDVTEDKDNDIHQETTISQNDNLQSRRTSSSGKVAKKLTFLLPEDFDDSYRDARKDRRMSTPALASNRIVKHQPNALNFKLGRQLEGLDLKSSVPLSPTRLREGLIFPEPFDREVLLTAE